MGLLNIFKKKEELELPELPPIDDLPEFDDLPNLKPDISPKPAMPKPMQEEQPIPTMPKLQPRPVVQPMPQLQPKPIVSGGYSIPKLKPITSPETEDMNEEIRMPPPPKNRPMINAPSYIKAENFKEMLGGVQVVKDNLRECDEIFGRLNQIKNDEDKEFEKWRSRLEDLQRKLIYVDKVLFEAKEGA